MMMTIHRSAVLVLSALLAAGCGRAGRTTTCADEGGRGPRPAGQGWYHGPIVSVDSSQVPGGGGAWIRNVMVQVQPEGRTTGRISFSVGSGTALLCRSGAPLSRGAPLAPGMTVSAKTRLILESDPGYASADTLIVDPPR